MRVGIDASNLRSGGGVTYIAELLAHAKPDRHGVESVTVWTSPSSIGRIPARSWLDCAPAAALQGGLPRRLFWQVFERSRLAAAAVDVVFAPGATPAGDFRPFVSMSMNMLPFDYPERRRYGWSPQHLRLCLLEGQQRRTFRRSDAVIFLTEFAREQVSERCRLPTDSRRVVIPSGVNERFLSPPRVARPLASHTLEEPFRFLYVSDVSPYKHQANVVEAAALLRRSGLPVALDLIGHPTDPRSLRRLEEKLASVADSRAVRFLGPLPHESLPLVYRDTDAFVFASTCENLPMTLVEAMGAGLPIAASDRRPMPDILGGGAVFFDPEDVPSIAAALRHLALDPTLRAECARLAHEAARRYSWGRCADQTFALLADVVRETKRRGPRA